MRHPIVVQTRPSDEQWSAILARGCDVAVTAGAGAGKTRTLVARYLSLLAEGLPLRAVVAITFTRKAAREMRSRARDEVRRSLGEARPELDPVERDRWQQLYTELDAARIGTIHSLCAEILRAHPAEAGLDPRFEVLAEGQVSVLQAQAIGEALAWAADDAKAVALFTLLGEQGLQSTLETLLKQPAEAAQCLAGPSDPLWPVWEAALIPPLRAFVDDDQVHAAFRELLALRADGAVARAETAGDALVAPLRDLLALWDEIHAARQQEDWSAISARLAPLRRSMKQAGRAANWQPADPKSIIRDLQALYDTQLSDWVGKGINLALDRQLAEAMPALRQVLARAHERYTALKRERRALDYDDLEGGALALLRDHPAVRAHWQAEVQALLVDEFQDTNGCQRDLVALLNGDGAKLFIVGDAKQSIYRFRGADVTVFRAERARIAQQGRSFDLATSYRAHRALVAGLNDLLRPVLGAGDPSRPWVEPFAPLEHHREEPGAGFGPAFIELHLTVGSKGGGALDRADRK
ncbi:MAG: UvrD-helicase domain-containing protein, partial [Chloroflexi bacterium]|nr:UvrD-helicase domain-containing protein [Chloroflexota bacterium]